MPQTKSPDDLQLIAKLIRFFHMRDNRRHDRNSRK